MPQRFHGQIVPVDLRVWFLRDHLSELNVQIPEESVQLLRGQITEDDEIVGVHLYLSVGHDVVGR